jgi:hypothetical protein
MKVEKRSRFIWAEPGFSLDLEAKMAEKKERVKILKMIEEGKITAEEGSRLLAALSRGKGARSALQVNEAKWLRIRVSELDTGKTTVNVNLPIGLVDVGLRMGARFVPDMEGIELEELSEALQQGMTGKVVDIVDEDEGQRVEIYFE